MKGPDDQAALATMPTPVLPYAARMAAGNPTIPGRWYRGDCHVHSSRSAGANLTPAQLVAAAQAAGLDFIATTEHNTVDGHGDWEPHLVGDLLVILGQEVVTGSGHWLALGIDPGSLVDWRYQVTDGVIAEQLARLHGRGVAVVAHPHAPYPSGSFKYPHEGFDLVEVWNGLWTSELDWQADNETALADWARSLNTASGDDTASPTTYTGHSGRWRAAVGGRRSATATPTSRARWAFRTPSCGRTNSLPPLSLPAFAMGAAGSRDPQRSTCRSRHPRGNREAGIGERLDSAGDPIVVRVDVTGVPAGSVSIHTGRGSVHRESLPDTQSAAVQWTTAANESAFVRVEVRHCNGAMAALSNPVILT